MMLQSRYYSQEEINEEAGQEADMAAKVVSQGLWKMGQIEM